MNILLSCVGRRGYIADYFRPHLEPSDLIIGTSNDPHTHGFAACDLGVVLPDIADVNYIPILLELCQEQQIEVLLSFFDQDINKLSQHLPELRTVGVVPMLPSPQVNEICFDKYQTYTFLRECELNTPQTFAELGQAIKALDGGQIGFPLMIKPRYGFASHDIFRARNFDELNVFFHYAPDMIIQEMVSGQECSYDICLDLNGQVLSVVPKRKIFWRGGDSDMETSDHPALIEVGYRLGQALGKLGHIGPLDADLFLQGDKVSILEMNPRFGGGYPASHKAGADFPHLIIEMVRGNQPEPRIGEFQPGIVMLKGLDLLVGTPTNFLGSIISKRFNDEGD